MDFEVWHFVLGIVGVGLTVLGIALKHGSNALSSMGERLDARLRSVENNSDKRWSEIERKMDRHEGRIHDLHIQVERRVTMLEARLAVIMDTNLGMREEG